MLKSKNRKIRRIVTSVILLFMVAFLLTPNISQAAPMPGCEIPPTEEGIYKPIKINFPLPNITQDNPPEQVGGNTVQTYSVKNLQCFVVGIYTYFAGVVGILATVMIMYGGVKYLISMGSPQRMSDAKDTIFSAVVGLVLVLGAYILLNLINPNLTELKVVKLETISPLTDFCTNVAKPEIENRTKCGDVGFYANKTKCIYGNCESADLACAKTLDENQNERYNCESLKDACESITRDTATEKSQKVCDPYSKPGFGLCRWANYEMLAVWQSNDQCRWMPVIKCDSGYAQTDCKDCVNADISCGFGRSAAAHCEASKSQPVYEAMIETPFNERQTSICCKKIGGNDLVCVN